MRRARKQVKTSTDNLARIRIERDGEAYRVVVGPVRDAQAWFAAVVTLVTGGIGLYILVSATGKAIAGPGPGPLVWSRARDATETIAFAFALMAALVLSARDVAWRLFGREEIHARSDRTTVTAVVLGVRRARSFRTAGILRVDWVQQRMKWVRGTRRNLAFDVGEGRIQLRSQLSLGEAEFLARAMRSAVDDLHRVEGCEAYRRQEPAGHPPA
jgi:hypothetical protein